MKSTSVLINTFNHAAYVEECLESVLTQTVPSGEIVVYDDGSTDDTPRILERFSRHITFIAGTRHGQPPHLGQANAIQTAFRRCSGDVVFLLDGDDRFKCDKIAHYLHALARTPDASLVQAPMDKIDEHGRPLGTSLEPRKHIAHHLREFYEQNDVDFFYPTSALAFSRAYLERVLPIDFSDGLPLWIDTRLGILAPYFGPIVTLPDALTEWRRHGSSDSLRVRNRKLQLQQTLMRTRVFNAYCRRHGFRTISLWRNRRFYLQVMRLILPTACYRLFYGYVRPLCTRTRLIAP